MWPPFFYFYQHNNLALVRHNNLAGVRCVHSARLNTFGNNLDNVSHKFSNSFLRLIPD